MKVEYSSRFKKQYKKLDLKLKETIKDKIRLLSKNELDPILNNHPLHGKLVGYRSINIHSDCRIIYRKEAGVLYMRAVGSHSELYS